MKHIGCFSGGKDSTALMLWMCENIGVPGVDWTPVFFDTGWEHPITYAYVEEVNQRVLGGALVELRSAEYESLMDCWLDHQMFSNDQVRFCTEDMKIAPLHEYLKGIDDEITTYQGIRAEESRKRARMRDTEECPVYADDKKLDVLFTYTIKRPLFRWLSAEVFAFSLQRGVEPNPLYKLGASRVGCWPCVLANLRDIKAYLIATPEIRARLINAETRMRERTGKDDRTFFRSGFIPARFCSLSSDVKCADCGGTGATSATDIRDMDVAMFGGHSCNLDSTCCRPPCKRCHGAKKYKTYVPTAEDVFRYIESVDEDQLPLLPSRSCMSVYNLCE